MIKPSKVLILLITVQLFLFGIIFFFPDGNLFENQNVSIKFLTLNEFLDKSNSKGLNQDSLKEMITASKIDTSSLSSDSGSFASSGDTSKSAFSDSLKANISFEDVKGLDSITYAIEYDSNKTNPLESFFSSLDTLISSGKKVRIFHYGDSQIEGDRVTSTLREKLQRKFGGCGVGLLPLVEINNVRSSINMEYGGTWKKNAIYGGLNKGYKSKEYGPLTSYFTYSNKQADSTHLGETPFVSYQKSYSAYSHAKKFETLSIYTSGGIKSEDIKLEKSEVKNFTENKLFYGKVNEFTWEFNKPISKTIINLNSQKNEGLYAIKMECNNGIAVDNVAMRGSSGVDFSKMKMDFYSNWLKYFNVKLIILEYGVNVVPFITTNYTFYEKNFLKQLRLLKAANPDASILVVGCSDVAIKQGTEYVSSPNIEKIKTAQKNAAFKVGAAFWDLQSAMGGQNSMPVWVNSIPSLAEKDYTHFNHRGARIVGEMLYNALLKEYVDRKTKKKHI